MTIDRFVQPDQDPRTEPPPQGGERATLAGFLTWQRQTLVLKCTGLDAEALARRAVEPSSMSLLGLVRHLTDVERGWFRRLIAGDQTPPLYWTPDDPDRDFDGARPEPELVAAAWAEWHAEVEFADRVVADAPTLDITGSTAAGATYSLRWVLVHMIEEYARHVGHVDLLRERLDGAVGE